MEDKSLEKLESRVDRLVDAFGRLKAENRELRKQLAEAESNKSLFRDRLDAIIDRLERAGNGVKSSHKIRVLGREIQVKSAASAESVREIESYVNERAAEVALSLPNADQQLVALLILLNTTESYLALQRGDAPGGTDFQAVTDRLLQKIDTALGE